MFNTSQPMNGKICLVTGATSGLGLVTAQALAQQGATVIGVGRSPEKIAIALNQIKQQTGNPNVEFWQADLSVQQDIRQLVQQFNSRYQHLHVLVNNAGAVILKRQQSADGIEMTFALNHLAYFLLTNLLLETLKVSVPSRIINVSSLAHQRGKINFDDLQGHKGYIGFRAYSQSKLANLLFTYELARQLEGTGVTVNAVHPGVVATNFGTNNGWLGRLLRPLFNQGAVTPQEGAQTIIYLATSPEVESVTGKYFVKQKAVSSSSTSYDQAIAKQLWLVSAQMTGLPEFSHST